MASAFLATPLAGFGIARLRIGRGAIGFRFGFFAGRARLADGRHDPDFQFGFDFLTEVDVDRVKAEFLERTFETHLVGRDRDFVLLEGRHDFGATDRTVQMAFVVGVGLDRDALGGNASANCRKPAMRAF